MNQYKKLLFVVVVFQLLYTTVAAQITLTSGNGYLDYPSGITSTVIRKEGVTDASQIITLTSSEKTVVRSYVDGFGRPIETVAQAASPNNKDIISFTKYRTPGSPQKDYLPYEGANGSGAYIDPSTAVTNQGNFYTANTYSYKVAQDNYPYAETVFEPSPMQRMLKQGNVGDGFQPTQNYKSFIHRSNNSSTETVRKWAADGSSPGTYATNDLAVAEGKDEANNKTWVYTDKMGRTVLKRQEGPSSTLLDTYYIYDAAGNVVYVVPPLGVNKMISTSTYNISACPNLIFSFVYDSRNRLVEKKVPGVASATYMVYDPLDRLVLMQDANMHIGGTGTQWFYMKYDAANRVVVQGMYTHGSAISRSAMQAHVDGQACYDPSSTTYYEQRSSATASYYTDVCFPVNGVGGASTEERQYNYYDDYNFDFDAFNTADYSYSTQGLTGEATATDVTSGLPTGQKRRIMDGGSDWLMSVSFYDKYYNVIQVRSNNQLNLSLDDLATTVSDFTRKPTIARMYKYTGSVTLTVQTKYIYDAGGRMTELKQSNNGGTEYTVAKYEYNALGQLIDKKLHSTNGVNYLQSVDYRYNIRGQLLSINNSARAINSLNNDESNDVFGMEFMYDQVDANIGNTANYTGMIGAVKWSGTNPVNSTPDQKSFIYTYDKVNRLSTAVYKGRANGGTGSFNKEVNGYNESFGYDANGNITSLQRSAWMSGSATQIDNLTYTYAGSNDNNRLSNITDAISTNSTGWGFRNFTGSGSGYTYDDNGNLIQDDKKGTIIEYNELNKPVRIAKTGTYKKVRFIYDATGVRLAKLIYDNTPALTKRVDYIGGVVIDDQATLAYYGMAEGRIRNDGGTLKAEYFIADQQGNTRSTFEDNGSGTAVVRQQTDYYAFGMQMAGAYNTTQPNKKLYNAGSEWQDDVLDIADYYSTFFREYDPVIGRFNGVDIKAEIAISWTTYQYSYNNPVNFNDPNGDLTQQEFNNIVDILMGSSHGGTWSKLGGFYTFMSSDEAFGYGATLMTQYGLWDMEYPGGGGSTANSFESALDKYNGGKVTAGMIKAYYMLKWQGTSKMVGNVKEVKNSHGAYFSVGYFEEGSANAYSFKEGGFRLFQRLNVSKDVKIFSDFANGFTMTDLIALKTIESSFISAAVTTRRYSSAKGFFNAAKNINKIGTGLSSVNVGLAVADIYTNDLNVRNGVDLTAGALGVIFPAFGVVYGVADLATLAFTGKGISEHIQDGVNYLRYDSKLNPTTTTTDMPSFRVGWNPYDPDPYYP